MQDDLPLPDPGMALPPTNTAAVTASPPRTSPPRKCQVFLADAFYVSSGANMGDSLGPPESVEIGDIYQLDPTAAPLRLSISDTGTAQSARLAQDCALGAQGAEIRLLASYTLMDPQGDPNTLILLDVEGALCGLPLSPMLPGVDYTLIASDAQVALRQLSQLMSLSFGRGTLITMADGRQQPVEQLSLGAQILTRDHGPQPLRMLGKASLRAIGAFAPVIIPAGVLGNSGDLVVAQHHRMFLYQRHKLPGLNSAELLVQARHLVNGETVYIREGGMTDWFSLVFDRHEIIYAEGIPCESLMVNEANVSRLPVEMAQEIRQRFPDLAQVQHFGTEAGRQALDRIGPESLYRQRPPTQRRPR